MKCPLKAREGEEVLLAYVSGRITRENSIELKAHAVSCEGCSGWLRSQSAVWALLDEWEPAAVSFDFERKLYRKIDESRSQSWIERTAQALTAWVAQPVVPLALASVLVLTGFLVDHHSFQPQPATHVRQTIMPVDAGQLDKELDDLQLLQQLDLVKDETTRQPGSM